MYFLLYEGDRLIPAASATAQHTVALKRVEVVDRGMSRIARRLRNAFRYIEGGSRFSCEAHGKSKGLQHDIGVRIGRSAPRRHALPGHWRHVTGACGCGRVRPCLKIGLGCAA